MPRKKQLHNSPIHGLHPRLASRVKTAGFSTDALSNFLWLINAHDRLIAFPKICQNILHILYEAQTTWGLSEQVFHLQDVVPILNWIVENESELTIDLGEEFNLQPRHGRDHPIINKGASRHPLYTAMWNTSEQDELRTKYLLLQAHMLYAHTTVLFAANNRDEYERYDGQTEWKGFENSPYLATLAVRDLSLANNAGYLKQLKLELPPDQFSKQVLTQVQIPDSEMMTRLQAFEKFIQKAAGIRDWRRRQGAGGSGQGGSNNVTGYIDFRDGLFEAEISIGDVDDLDTTVVKLNQVSETNLSNKEVAELLDSDLCPNEFDSDELYLISTPDESVSIGNIASISASQIRHVVMANQLFPWSVHQLTMQEVAHLIITSKKISDELFKNKNRTDDEQLKLEAIILMRIMLFTGSDFDRAISTLVLQEQNQNIDASIAYIHSPDKGPLWKIRAIQPAYKTPIATNNPGEKQRADYFYLEENAFSDTLINKFLAKKLQHNPNSSDEESNLNVTGSSRLFRRKQDRLSKALRKFIAEIDPTGRLTVLKISNFLFHHLLVTSNRDICAASIITGSEHRLAHVRMFYYVIPIGHLQKIYSTTVTNIVSILYALVGEAYQKPAYPSSLKQDKFVGSRNCPTLDTVSSGMSRLRTDIENALNKSDRVKFHNLYTLFITWQFSFATGCRAIRTPFIPLEDIDFQSGLGVLTDKDDGSGYKSRLIWLPPTIIESMQVYERYRTNIDWLTGLKIEDCPPIFFIERINDQKMKMVEVRPASLQPIMQDYLSYRPNVHRRLMRTELLNKNCPIEVVDAWMGHWHIGEEPWSTYSSFSFDEHQRSLEEFIVPLLDRIHLLAPITEGSIQ